MVLSSDKRDFNPEYSMSSSKTNTLHSYSSADAMDNFKRDRFELLSAYLDGEVTAAERRQVEDWLANDPTVQQLYSRLLKLRQGIRAVPMTLVEQPVECTVQQVMAKVRRPSQFMWTWGSAAIAAAFVGLLVNDISIGPAATSHIASSPTLEVIPEAIESDVLMIALDHPIIEIPGVAVDTTGATVYEIKDAVP
ncbi:MAG: transcriptional regulator [Leptolyngbyaceae cyanobacterium SL_7_1]|nr:transcriptional regulator [Leptolyngbyaceae cyanobacterium SL_7_1]